MRFGFGEGILWAQELTLHLSAWLVLFGASYGIKVGSHIGVDAVVRLLPRCWHRVVSVVAIALSLVYCALFAVGSWVYLEKMYQIGIGLEDVHIPQPVMSLFSDDFAWEVLRIDFEDPAMPLWLAHGMLLVGLAFLVIRLLILMGDVIAGKTDGFRFADEAKESMHLAGMDEGRDIGEGRP